VIRIDLEAGTVEEESASGMRSYPIGTPEAFAIISKAWLRSGWDNKQVYSFTWMGRPIIQLPEDLVRLQEVLHRLRPDVLIETGVAHGGSLVFYASLFKVLGRGRVIGIDIEIRPHNRRALEEHELSPYITLVEGSSVERSLVDRVAGLVRPGEKVMVMLDSNHTKEHVLKELEAYGPLVSAGSYIVAADGIMQDVVGAPRTQPDWTWNNPRAAATEFLKSHPEFVLETPAFEFNEGTITEPVTYWPGAWLRKLAK
jgi:cephalosporin hydroxylase